MDSRNTESVTALLESWRQGDSAASEKARRYLEANELDAVEGRGDPRVLRGDNAPKLATRAAA